ncbi:hypothetical protein [Bacillus sp. OK048]|nr:hypothetical protein [Bacillus sp. OK048]
MVNGQLRITTILILLTAIRDLAEEVPLLKRKRNMSNQSLC